MPYLDIAKRTEARLSSYEKNEINERIPPPALTWDQLVDRVRREPDARCNCGGRADHLRSDGTWQCQRCAGHPLLEPEVLPPDLAAACDEYDDLHGQLRDLAGPLIRARDAGDHAEVARLQGEMGPLQRRYHETAARVAALGEVRP